MENNNKVTLIDGTFSIAEAKDVLINMFTMKINFHQQKNVSHIERFGKPDEAAKEKVSFLKSELAKLEACIEKADSDNATLKVTSAIHIDYLIESASIK
jgi:DNA-directed RNA polymerase subunit F